MHVHVNGVRLYFDVDGAGLVADGARMRQRPTVILVHGGPGVDHSIYKPAFSALTDTAQIVTYDQRGCGRSDDGDPADWTLAQWAADLKGLCDALGIEKPVVYGASFGGFVAQAYATRYPDHPAKIALVSTAAKVEFETMFEAFRVIGGDEASAVARAYWTNPTVETRRRHMEVCVPLYTTRGPPVPEWIARALVKAPVALHFNGPHNEQERFDFRAALAGVRCPTLVLAGERDPVMPIAFSETIAASLPRDLVRFERFADCGHGVVPDAPERAFAVLRDFIAA